MPERKGVNRPDFGFAAFQFTAVSPADHEKFLAIFAGKRSEQTERAGSQLDRLARGWLKKPSLFRECPNLPLRLENEIFSVRRPFPAAFVWRIVPSGKQRVQIRPLRRNLPE